MELFWSMSSRRFGAANTRGTDEMLLKDKSTWISLDEAEAYSALMGPLIRLCCNRRYSSAGGTEGRSPRSLLALASRVNREGAARAQLPPTSPSSKFELMLIYLRLGGRRRVDNPPVKRLSCARNQVRAKHFERLGSGPKMRLP